MLLAPARAGRRHNVANTLKKRSIAADGPTAVSTAGVWIPPRSSRDEATTLATAVRAKIEDGNIRAAARILCSDERPAAVDGATLDALRKRHPPAPSDYSSPPEPTEYSAIQVTEADVTRAIRSFPAGSSGGPDGLRPQHLVDMFTCPASGPGLITAITGLVNLLLQGCCPPQVTQILFGGRLFALQKKAGGVRPIAIGYTWRRLAAKCANIYALAALGDRMLPVQVGVGTPGGCEAAVHATRRFLTNMSDSAMLVKLDFTNAFNSIRRDVMLNTVASELPGIYRFCMLSYGRPTALQFGPHTVWSEEGAQQGDPLGPLLFCLSIQPLLESLKSELVIGFMDDVTIGGNHDTVAQDVENVINKGRNFGLSLNVKNARQLLETEIDCPGSLTGSVWFNQTV